MLLLTTTAHTTLYQHPDPDGRPVHRNLGRLLQPRHTSRAEATAEAGIPWAADNDCFQALDPEAFVKMLDRIKGLPGCRFVTVPDVVGDARATARQFEKWAPAVERRGLPVCLVLQDGIEELDRWLAMAWHRLDAVFVGGSTEFKMGPIPVGLLKIAKKGGKWTHVGRVNTRRRFDYFAGLGTVDSVDGTKFAMFRKTYLDEGLAWTLAPARQLSFA